jgi:hypothetical protein
VVDVWEVAAFNRCVRGPPGYMVTEGVTMSCHITRHVMVQ